MSATDTSSKAGPRLRGGRIAYLALTALFSLLALCAAALALKRSFLDRPQLETLIAHGMELKARVTNPRDSSGRASFPMIDLTWTTPDGSTCVARDYPISKEMFRSLAGSEVGIIVDPKAPHCHAALSADLEFARQQANPIPFIAAILMLAVGGTISALAAAGAGHKSRRSASPH